jgi:hypothetical protein
VAVAGRDVFHDIPPKIRLDFFHRPRRLNRLKPQSGHIRFAAAPKDEHQNRGEDTQE